MTSGDVPTDPNVLNTTVLSNFAYVDKLWLITELSGICTVPVVRDELEQGVDAHSYLRSALNLLDDDIPVGTVSRQVRNRATVVSEYLDSGEAQAFAMADVHNGRLLTDDGDARSFAREQSVPVVGSVGVLLAAINAGKISEDTADKWLSTWIDEMGFYAPYQDIAKYR